MGKVKVTVAGGAGIHGRFAELRRAVAGANLETPAAAGAVVIQRRWKENVEVDTGTYRRSVHIGGHSSPEGEPGPHVKVTQAIPEPEVAEHRAEVVVGTDIIDPPYPWFREMGTAHAAAHPAATMAFDEGLEEAKREIADVARILIEQRMKR